MPESLPFSLAKHCIQLNSVFIILFRLSYVNLYLFKTTETKIVQCLPIQNCPVFCKIHIKRYPFLSFNIILLQKDEITEQIRKEYLYLLCTVVPTILFFYLNRFAYSFCFQYFLIIFQLGFWHFHGCFFINSFQSIASYLL